MIPYLVAERASLWDAEIRGAFLHVRQAHTPEHFLRAGVEGVAYQLWTILRRVRMINRVEEVRATGQERRLWQYYATLCENPDRSGDYAVIGTTLQIVGESLAEAVDIRAGERVLDVAAGNGDPELCIFGEEVTPNQHKMVRDFVLLDNRSLQVPEADITPDVLAKARASLA